MRIVFAFMILLAGCSSSSFEVANPGDGAVVDSTTSDDVATTDTGMVEDAASPVDSGGGMTEAGGGETIASDAGSPMCGDPSTFPPFEKGCTTDLNCSFGLHQVDCCGSQVAIGFNHALKGSFDTAETTWRATCPVCDCMPSPTKADDGKTGEMIGVRCSSGMCKTYVK